MIEEIFIDKKTIEHQFISYCKTVLWNEVRDITAEEKRWNEKHILFDDLKIEDKNKLCVCDYYDVEAVTFYAYGNRISIDDKEIAEAVACLPEMQRNIILLTFFDENKDVEVAKLIGIAQSTLHYHKQKAFETLRKLMKGARMKWQALNVPLNIK